jgi:hypothetical protein
VRELDKFLGAGFGGGGAALGVAGRHLYRTLEVFWGLGWARSGSADRGVA